MSVVDGYSFVDDNTPTLIVYCIIWNIIEAPEPHSFAMESVKICHFKTFRAGNFALRIFCCIFLLCEDISVEYKFKSEKFKGCIDWYKIK